MMQMLLLNLADLIRQHHSNQSFIVSSLRARQLITSFIIPTLIVRYSSVMHAMA